GERFGAIERGLVGGDERAAVAAEPEKALAVRPLQRAQRLRAHAVAAHAGGVAEAQDVRVSAGRRRRRGEQRQRDEANEWANESHNSSDALDDGERAAVSATRAPHSATS